MASPTTHPIWYVYGIVPADTPMASPPAGIDDSRVRLEQHAGVAALVSVLDDPGYSPAEIEANSGNVEWLSPRAVAHDRVLTWASDHGAVVPLPMFSLFSGDEALRQMLDDRASQLIATLARVGRGREYALRVSRDDAELRRRRVAGPALSPRAKAGRRAEIGDACGDAAHRRGNCRFALAERDRRTAFAHS